MSNVRLSKPSEKTWFIAWDGVGNQIKTYGVCDVTQTLRFWAPLSYSNPAPGITQVINTFYSPDKKISIYVFGDDFSSGSVEAVCRTVARVNKADRFGNRLVRIHGVGFPSGGIR